MSSLASKIKTELGNAYKDAKVPINMNTMDSMRQYTSKLSEENLEGGLADGKSLMDIAQKHAYDDSTDSTTKSRIQKMFNYLKTQLEKGIKVEMEHTKSKVKAKEIAMDHLFEDPKYYEKLSKIETKEATSTGSSGAYQTVFGGDSEFWKKSEKESKKAVSEGLDGAETTEATGTGSSGAYETPAMWAKTTSKKDWGPSRKTQWKGGAFVKVKKKCSKFPYCNQGDINALKITKNESVNEAIQSVAKKMGVSKNIVENIVIEELTKFYKSKK